MRIPSWPMMLVGLVLMAAPAAVFAKDTNTVNEAEAAYARSLAQRVGKIVSALGVEDSAKSNRVHGLIVQQYRDLSKIHEARDAKIKSAKLQASGSKEAVAATTKA